MNSKALLELEEQCMEMLIRIREAMDETEKPPNYPCIVLGRCEQVSQHAIDRYRQRTKTSKTDDTIIKRLRTALANAAEWQLKEKYRLSELLNHGGKAEFYRNREIMFVVKNGIVATCLNPTANRWELAR